MDGQIPAQPLTYVGAVLHQQEQAHHGGTSPIIGVVEPELHLLETLDLLVTIHQEAVLMPT